MYFQLLFALDRVKVLAPLGPESEEKRLWPRCFSGDVRGVLTGGERKLRNRFGHHARTGMTNKKLEQIARDWIAKARHPRFNRPYTEMRLPADAGAARLSARQRLQDLHRLRRRRRVHAALDRESLWHTARTGRRQQHQDPVRDAGRQAGAHASGADRTSSTTRTRQARRHQRAHWHAARSPRSATPTATCQMLEWTMGGDGLRFALIVHHTDAEREWAYDRNSSIGRLDKALDEARAKGWTVVDMKSDWKTIFPFGSK